ncbi:MAG TPA: TonB-dependent receptor [Vicinamibacterales bacterium]|nr:TonB-dependent receptor [Vicinamibacterales bacterium]
MQRYFTLVTRIALGCALVAWLAPPASAQIPTGTITGRVTDAGALPTPGVTVALESPNLQGTRTTVTAQNGDYIFRLLPPGQYTITFTLAGFATTKESRDVAAAQTLTLDVTLKPASVAESITVSVDRPLFAPTVEASTNIKATVLDLLPSTRTLLGAVSLAPAVHSTGPGNGYSIGGAMSFENLFMLNGVQIQDNLRGTPFSLFIEDAIQETTIATSGISAEYGRFTGGVVNAITKSGSNTPSGSFRTSFANDDWRAVSPYGEPKVDKTVPTYEFTFGGPLRRDRTWFFGAGRLFDSTTAQETSITGVDYDFTADEKRWEGKVTQTLTSAHRLQGAFLALTRDEINNAWPSPGEVMDTRSLTTRQLPQNLFSLHYTGTLGSRFALEAQYSMRNFTFEGDGGTNTDLVQGSPLRDLNTGKWWWAPNFCGVCTPEQRDNTDLLVKGSYFLTTARGGSHNIVFGYDSFNDKVTSDNYQSATNYHVWATDIITDNNVVYPVIDNQQNTYIIWWPLNEASQGTNFRTHSLFINDDWQLNRHTTFNLGLRYDANRGRDGSDNLVANDSIVSPRLGVTFDPKGDGRWVFNASYGRYVAALANNIAASTAPGGTPSIIAFFYGGAPINVNGGPLVSSEAALRQVFDWFNANGGTGMAPFFTNIPGLASRVEGTLKSPHADEFSFGVSHQIGSHAAVRADFVHRKFGSFYATRIDQSTGQVFDEFGTPYDLSLLENTDVLTRRYDALNLQGSYRFGGRGELGASYTLSELQGNVDGETVNQGPLSSGVLTYPEYSEPAWSNPEGDLAADQRHRLRLWGTVTLMPDGHHGTLSIGAIQSMQSGTPYGAVGAIRTGAFVGNLGYVTPPSTVPYYFTARDEFRTDSMFRTDVSVNYSIALPGARRARLFGQAQVLNLFNQFGLFNLTHNEINTSVLTRFNSSQYQAFNPFTTTPVQGVNWDYDQDFGTATASGAYTLPRTFQFSVGIRF